LRSSVLLAQPPKDVQADGYFPTKKDTKWVYKVGETTITVRVASVEENRSIANVLPGWKLGDILEGDTVFPLN
jgi:hypothetical protein